MKVGYIGFCNRVIKELVKSKEYKLSVLIIDKERINEEIIDIAKKYNIPIFLVENKIELAQIIKSFIQEVEFFIVAKSKMIIPIEFINQADFFNFHFGDLLTNRGAHSITWSILDGVEKTKLSLHKIGKKIDTGILIGTYEVKISDDDTTNSLMENMENGVPILLKKLKEFIEGKIKGVLINDGLYKNKVTEKDYTIDLKTDSIKIIKKKIYSQKDYDGAIIILNGEKAKVLDFYEENSIFLKKELSNDVLGIDIENRKVYLKIKN